MSLAAMLNSFYAKHGSYETLFDKTLQESDGFWDLTNKKIKTKNLADHYTSLAIKIINENPAAISDCNNFLIRFNQEWTKARKIQLIEPSCESPIFFNSKIAKFSFLSNFFPTLILSNNPIESSEGRDLTPSNSTANSESKSRIYYCLETAYLAQRVALMDPSRAMQIVSLTDPVEAKKIASKAKKSYLSNKSQEDDEKEKLELMEDLLRKKFSQNPILMDLLHSTNSKKLVEKTSDAFWGCGTDEDSSEISGQNNLGRLLEKIRG